MHINHVSNLKFLCDFRQHFFPSITKNIQGGFAGAGLAPYDRERVLSKMDIKLCTPPELVGSYPTTLGLSDTTQDCLLRKLPTGTAAPKLCADPEY